MGSSRCPSWHINSFQIPWTHLYLASTITGYLLVCANCVAATVTYNFPTLINPAIKLTGMCEWDKPQTFLISCDKELFSKLKMCNIFLGLWVASCWTLPTYPHIRWHCKGMNSSAPYIWFSTVLPREWYKNYKQFSPQRQCLPGKAVQLSFFVFSYIFWKWFKDFMCTCKKPAAVNMKVFL